MNRADLRRDIFIVVGIYFLWTVIGASLFYIDSFVTEGADLAVTPGGHLHRYQYFELFKELTPVVVLLPVAWVGYSFQRRISFVNDLRQFWPDLVEAVQRTVEYLRREEGDRRDYERTLTALRCRIDDARALFRRSAATETGSGKYPYEGITRIHDMLKEFGYHDAPSAEEAKQVRSEIVAEWQRVRGQILREFDRANVD